MSQRNGLFRQMQNLRDDKFMIISTYKYCLFIVFFCFSVSLTIVRGDIIANGKVTENNLNGMKYEYRFTSQVGTNGYSMQLYEHKNTGKSNIVAQIYHDQNDTIVLNMQAIGKTIRNETHNIEGGKSIYKSTLNSTSFPFRAHSAIQLVWLATYASQNIVTNLIQNYPPGIVFSDIFPSESVNWYDFSLKEMEFHSSKGLLCRFSQYPPETRLTTAEKLLSQGVPRNAIDALPHSPYEQDKLIVQVGELERSRPVYTFESSGFSEESPFAATSVLRYYSPPQPPEGAQLLFYESILTIENICETTNSILPPEIDSPLVTINDYRFNGIRAKPLSYGITNKEWPLFGTPTYQDMERRAKEQHRVSPKKASPFAILLIIIAVFSPLILLKLKHKL